jgi:hypothetical protein
MRKRERERERKRKWAMGEAHTDREKSQKIPTLPHPNNAERKKEEEKEEGESERERWQFAIILQAVRPFGNVRRNESFRSPLLSEQAARSRRKNISGIGRTDENHLKNVVAVFFWIGQEHLHRFRGFRIEKPSNKK